MLRWAVGSPKLGCGLQGWYRIMEVPSMSWGVFTFSHPSHSKPGTLGVAMKYGMGIFVGWSNTWIKPCVSFPVVMLFTSFAEHQSTPAFFQVRKLTRHCPTKLIGFVRSNGLFRGAYWSCVHNIFRESLIGHKSLAMNIHSSVVWPANNAYHL